VILDDEESAHYLWKDVLKNHGDDLTLAFFTDGREALNFIESSHRKNQMFLLADYNLRSDITGLQVILESGMKDRSLVVTSIYNDKMIQDLVESSALKILPKQLLDCVPVTVR
jgi:CheY-like chemotaxis protein